MAILYYDNAAGLYALSHFDPYDRLVIISALDSYGIVLFTGCQAGKAEVVPAIGHQTLTAACCDFDGEELHSRSAWKIHQPGLDVGLAQA